MTSTEYDTVIDPLTGVGQTVAEKQHVRYRLAAFIAENRLPAPRSVYVWPESVNVHLETLADLRAYAAAVGEEINATAVIEDDTDKLVAWAFVAPQYPGLELPGVPLPVRIQWWPR